MIKVECEVIICTCAELLLLNDDSLYCDADNSLCRRKTTQRWCVCRPRRNWQIHQECVIRSCHLSPVIEVNNTEKISSTAILMYGPGPSTSWPGAWRKGCFSIPETLNKVPVVDADKDGRKWTIHWPSCADPWISLLSRINVSTFLFIFQIEDRIQ